MLGRLLGLVLIVSGRGWNSLKIMSEFLSTKGFRWSNSLCSVACTKQEGLTLLKEQAQALKLLSEGKDVFVYSKSLCYQLLPLLMDYKLGRTSAPLVHRNPELKSP